MEQPKINIYQFICKLNADAKITDINNQMRTDTCDYMAHILDFFGYTLGADFYKQEYPQWYLVLEQLVINIATANLIFK